MADMLAGHDLEPTLRQRLGSLRLAVVGHVEWAEFLRVPHLPTAGEITHVTDRWEAPAGGGAVTAVQLARLAGHATLLTALGDDELGHRAADELRGLGVDVRAMFREGQPQRRVIVHLDGSGERTITVIGDRMGPRGDDPFGWSDLDFDAVYFTAGDVGAVRAARRARILTATARALATLREAKVSIDALVQSRLDDGRALRGGRSVASTRPRRRDRAQRRRTLGGAQPKPRSLRRCQAARPRPGHLRLRGRLRGRAHRRARRRSRCPRLTRPRRPVWRLGRVARRSLRPLTEEAFRPSRA